MNQQLALSLPLKNQATLADFCWDKNTILKHEIQRALSYQGERFITIWGGLGSGKTHLLQGICQTAMQQHQLDAMYLPLSILKEWGPESIEGLSNQSLIAIDDMDAIAGCPEWENALFALFNQIYDNERTILFTSNHTPPAASAIHLPDLRSRLNWGLVIELRELDDASKMNVLQDQAQKRGFDLPDGVALFLIHRWSRNMNALHMILDKLDQASLAAQRKITIPFVKAVLGI